MPDQVAYTYTMHVLCACIAVEFIGSVCLDMAMMMHADGDEGLSEWVEMRLAWPMLAYQTWNSIYSFCVNELRTKVGMAHHVVAASLAFLALYPQPYLHYFTVCYFGVSEISTVIRCAPGCLG
jgi:hypothetical protein